MRKHGADPAASIISRLGGAISVAKITGKDISRVYRWAYSKERGGTGGRIPAEDIPTLVKHAEENGIPLSYADFFETPPEAAE